MLRTRQAVHTQTKASAYVAPSRTSGRPASIAVRARSAQLLASRVAPNRLVRVAGRTHSSHSVPRVETTKKFFAAMDTLPMMGSAGLLLAAGAIALLALNGDEAEAAEKKETSPQQFEDAQDAVELLNVRDFSIEQAKMWLSSYAATPNPDAFLSGIRPLLRDLFAALEEAEKAGGDEAPPDDVQYRMMHLIGFIGGAANRHSNQVLPRLEALMLTQNDLSEQPGLLLGVLMPALILAGTKDAGMLAMQVYSLMREMEAEFNKTPKPDNKKIGAEFQKMAQNMLRGMFPVLPMICLGRFAATGDVKVLEQAYASLNKLLTEVAGEMKSGNAPKEAEQAANALKSVCAHAFKEFARSSPTAAKAMAENPVSKEKYPLAFNLIRDAKDAQRPIKAKK